MQRRLLGWKRFWYESIKYDKATKKWKASVYRAPLRKSLVAFVTQHGFHALNKVDDVQPSVIGKINCVIHSFPFGDRTLRY